MWISHHHHISVGCSHRIGVATTVRRRQWSQKQIIHNKYNIQQKTWKKANVIEDFIDKKKRLWLSNRSSVLCKAHKNSWNFLFLVHHRRRHIIFNVNSCVIRYVTALATPHTSLYKILTSIHKSEVSEVLARSISSNKKNTYLKKRSLKENDKTFFTSFCI